MKTNKLILLAAGLLVLFLFSGCGKTIMVDSTMNGASVELKKGQLMVLKLPSNPTTGFDWEIVSIDPSIIKQSGEMSYKSDSKLAGSGGVDTWTFEAASSGTTRLVLSYHRSWEKDVEPLQVFNLDIVVK
jgi:inhibitor of cysteine peptidase